MKFATPTEFVASVARALDDIARQARAAAPQLAGASALDLVVRCVADTARAARPVTHPLCDAREHEQRPITDPRWHTLWTACGEPATYTVEATGEQGRFLAQLGMDAGYADPGRVIQTLAILALRDRSAKLRREQSEAEADRENMRTMRAELDALQEKANQIARNVADTEAERDEIAARAATLATELAHERAVVEFLRDLTGSTDEPEAPAHHTGSVAVARAPRRTKIDGETGIYQTSWGALEIVYKAAGKQHYETVSSGDIAEARALREQRVAEARNTDTEAEEAS